MNKAIMILALMVIFGNIMVSMNCNEAINIIMKSMEKAPLKDRFKAFHYLFEKPYDLNSEEALNRYKIFKKNVKYIDESNSKNLEYTLGINFFADLTNEEYKNGYLGNKQDVEDINKEVSLLDEEIESIGDEYDNIDHSLYLSEPRDQKSCGSCWAFASTATIEAHIRKFHGKSVTLSPQSLVDCDPNSNCDGGVPVKYWTFLTSDGMSYDSAYPYVSGKSKTSHSCKREIPRNKVVKEFEYYRNQSEILKGLTYGPVQVGMDAESEEFAFYQSGVVTLRCGTPNHAVILYGRSKDALGGILKIRNSHGKKYGMNGNIWIREGASLYSCYVYLQGFRPIININNLLPEPQPQSCIKIYDNCFFKGKSEEICATASKFNIGNVSSLSLGKLAEEDVHFFEKENCAGEKFSIFEDQKCNSKPIKSLIVESTDKPEERCIWGYDEACHSGQKKTFCWDKSSDDKQIDLNGFKLASFKFPDKGVLYISVGKGRWDSILEFSSVYSIKESHFKKAEWIKISGY